METKDFPGQVYTFGEICKYDCGFTNERRRKRPGESVSGNALCVHVQPSLVQDNELFRLLRSGEENATESDLDASGDHAFANGEREAPR